MKAQRSAATAVMVFHRVPDIAGFDGWLSELGTAARGAPGFETARPTVHDSGDMDWALAVTFDNQESLHGWLDSADRSRVVRAGEALGYWSSTSDFLITDGQEPPPGIGAFRHSVASGREGAFRAVQAELNEASAGFPGYLGTALFRPDSGDEWLSVVRFRTAEQLSRWLRSDERAAVLGELRTSLTKEFAPVSSTTPFATTVRTENGRTVMTPDWKSAMLVLLVLYPTVMILSRFLGPILDRFGAQPWLALWLSNVISVSALQWFLMPWITRPFRRWLDPLDGAGLRISVVGAAVIVVGYAVTLTLFATVTWLQYWDFGD